ncbi:hypothetical protein MKQ70_25215 [Chitinophaga sedimenti]|nr:hypothetical protein [Chitinophaga sedimenti]MCK7558126.1 hypothetical protein [Chitinophaga sedimenti]
MKGSGNISEMISQQFRIHTKKLGLNLEKFEFNTSAFERPQVQLKLF